MSQRKIQSYKQKLLDALALKKKGREALHERVSLLVSVFNDREFRDAHSSFSDFQLAEILDAYLEDTAVDFLEAKAILDVFPNLRDWEGKKIRELYESAAESGRVATGDKQRATPRRVTIKEFEAEQLACKDAEAQVRSLKTRVMELESENNRLIRENAQLEGRVAELERIASRELVAR